MNAHWSSVLEKIGACEAAISWCETTSSLKEAWETCPRGDWMLWLAARVCDRKLVVLAACACARTALRFVSDGETRPLRAIETTEAWAHGNASIDDVRRAANATYAAVAAAAAAVADAAADAAAAYDAAANATYAACAAANAADAAAYAACAAANAAYATYAASANAAAASASRQQSLLDSANICRHMLPVPTLIQIREAVLR